MSPTRTCLGCMHPDAKDAMVRIAELDGAVVADTSGRLQGRGGYLHPRPECLERFVNSKVKVFRSLGRRIDPAERRAVAETIQDRLAYQPDAGIN